MTRRIALLCLLLATVAGVASAQQAARLRADGNGVAALQRPVTVALDRVKLRDALPLPSSGVAAYAPAFSDPGESA